MKYKKIVLAGGNGYLGGVLADYYRPFTEEIIILSRGTASAKGNIKTVHWDAKTSGKWEDSFFQHNTPLTRKIALRMGIVFGSKDGAFPAC
ncbi:hypothetical protein [Dyadobacter pollutisoli]|uniref:Uncharacterized protein n=1 Tax=Dyadobacter pollutisoli TaxID=2910158 RepID=A0A9E8SLX0_9BACT|nr:hypothetical protein [Dyadobacter pollutisoli]WAC12659.1 hypothetical protein ON006_01580 [Dyadobacter pollutisoli]